MTIFNFENQSIGEYYFDIYFNDLEKKNSKKGDFENFSGPDALSKILLFSVM